MDKYKIPELKDVTVEVSGLTDDHKIAMLHSAFCNGLPYFYGYDLDLRPSDNLRYRAFVVNCFEDRLIEYLKEGYDIEVVQDEADVIETFNLVKFKQNFATIPNKVILAYITETDDADTADLFLQYAIFGEHIYG